jgi:hypothetical protein
MFLEPLGQGRMKAKLGSREKALVLLGIRVGNIESVRNRGFVAMMLHSVSI